MNNDLESQIRAWVEDVDDPIPVDDVRLGQYSWGSARRRGQIVLAAAAVFLVIAGGVAVLADSGNSSDLETVADSVDDETTTVPETSTAPTRAATDAGDESTTMTAAPTTTASTTPTTAVGAGPVSDVIDTPDGASCQSLRSRTVWATTGTAGELAAAAGARADYVETVTNEGTETCTMVFERCPAPGLLFTAEGEPAPGTIHTCAAIGHPPADLAPGESRQDVFAAELFTNPGDYELRVVQHDGRVSTLPIRLEPQVPACDPGTLALDQQPFSAFVSRNDTTFAQLFIDAAQQSCTIRIIDTRLTLRPEGEPDAAERTFIDGAQRWYTTGPDPTETQADFGPIDLPAAQYEGAITIQLENGETLRKPARLLVG